MEATPTEASTATGALVNFSRSGLLETGLEWLRRYAAENAGGALSGAVSCMVGHPFDTVKVRLQAGRMAYTSALQCTTSTVRTEGFRALYKGLLPPLLMTSSMNALVFSTWQEAQRLLHFEEGTDAPLEKVFL